MASFLDVDLKQVAQVIERWAGAPEMPLLLDRCRFRIALRHNQTAQGAAVCPWPGLPDRLALMVSEGNRAVWYRLGQKDAPAILGHLNIVEMRPAVGLHTDGRTQVHVILRRALWTQRLPPL